MDHLAASKVSFEILASRWSRSVNCSRLKDTRLKKSRIPAGFVGSRKKLMHNTRQSVRNRNSLEPCRSNMSCQFSIKLVQCNKATLSLR